MKELFMGSDASKGYCDFVILDSDENVVLKNFQLDDTPIGQTQLRKVIDVLFEEPGVMLYVALESTGGYENNWFKLFFDLVENENKKHKIRLTRLNPIGVHFYIKSSQKKITTDKVSAISICEFLIRNKKQHFLRIAQFRSYLIIDQEPIFIEVEKIVPARYLGEILPTSLYSVRSV